MNKDSRSLQFIRRIVSTLALPVIVIVVLGCFRPDIYFQPKTLGILLTQAIPYALIGWAMVFGISVGLFDFSVGSIVILAGLVGINMSQYFGLAGFILGTLLAAILMGLFTGSLFAALKIPSIITGFAALLIFESLATIYQKKFEVIVTNNMKIFGQAPGIYIVALLTFVLVYILFNNTKFGYQIKAIGGNEAVAKSMGINSTRLKLTTYVIGGLFLGIATLVKVGYQGTTTAVTNMSSMTQVFTPMMGVLIGMFISSCNPIIGVFIGELTITAVSSGLVSLGIESRLQNVVVGIFLLVFIGFKLNSQAFDFKKLFSKKTASLSTQGE
jgi:ribose transport system permease protein